MDRHELLKAAVEKWGKESQVFMAIEEMAELIKALSKDYRRQSAEQIFNVIEEIADVRIMLDQMIVIFEPISKYYGLHSVEDAEEGKLTRLAYLLGQEYTEKSEGDAR